MRRIIASSRPRAALAALTFAVACSTGGPQWADANRRVIEQNHVTGRTREVPSVRVPMALADGEPVEAATLPTVTIAPGKSTSLLHFIVLGTRVNTANNAAQRHFGLVRNRCSAAIVTGIQ